MKKSKVVTMKDVLAQVRDGQRILCGGFTAVGEPRQVLEALADAGRKELTMIGVDAGVAGKGGKERLVREGCVKRLITTHIGLNPVTATLMAQGKITVDLVPMGTLIEQIRCGGFGLGGVLTPTGLGTEVQNGKRMIEVEGTLFLLEAPIRADVAILKAWKADQAGNLVYRRTGKNYNPVMAMAADYVIAEVDEIVKIGEIDPDQVDTPGVCVDMVVKG